MRYKILLGCLVLSGFSGLAYELLWTRLLSFVFGSTTLSFSAVLAVFFGGLALGAWLAGKKSAGLTRPVRAYAFIEIATGLLGLALYPLINRLDLLFASIDPGLGFAGALIRLLVATPLLIVPTFLMGATLPIVCTAMIHRDEDVGRGTALVYGFNTLGAFLGAYAITYHLIPGVGVFRSILVTAGINFLVGAVALVAERRRIGNEVPAPAAVSGVVSGRDSILAEEASSDEHRRIVAVATVLTFLSGFAFIAYEVVWARLFSAFLQGTVYGVGAVLICFLVGIAVGSLLIARRVPASSDVGLWFAVLQTITVGSVLLISRELTRIAHTLQNLGATRSEGLFPQHMQLLIVFLTLSIPTICSGASFPLLVKIVESRARRTGRALGSLYAANTFGSILGSLATGFVLIPEFGSVGAILLATALVGLAAALGGLLLSAGRRRLPGLGVAGVALLLVGLYQGFDVTLVSMNVQPRKELYEQYIHRHQEAGRWLVYFAEGRDGTVAVFDYPDIRSMNINGLGQGGRHKWPPYHVLESLLVGMVPLAHMEAPENTLVVGLGAGITVDLLRKFGVPRITVVEIEPRVVDAVTVIFNNQSPVEAEGIDVVRDDARHYLLLAARRRGKPYDIITSMPAHPWVTPALFTREFFELAKVNLSSRGVFSTWFGVATMDAASVESLLRAFCSVFHHYVIYFVPEVEAYYLVGGVEALSIDMDRLATLHAHRSVGERPELLDPYFLPTRIYATGDARVPPPPEGIVNTDDSAFVEVHAPRSGNTSPRLRGFLPREYLHPSMVPERQRHAVFVELLEQLLGSPGGRVPLTLTPMGPQRSRRTLDAARTLLTEPERAYFEGRIAISSSASEEARAFFDQVAIGDDEIAQRARLFRALTYSGGSQSRLDALLALEPSTDVILEVIEIDTERGLDLAAGSSNGRDTDGAGWFLWKAATAKPKSLSAEDRMRFIQDIGAELVKSNRLNLLALAERFARGQGLDLEAETFASRRRELAVAEADRLYKEGVAAGVEGRYEESAEALWKANNLEPGKELTMRLLLLALMEIGDGVRAERLMEEFRFIGRSESHIRALVADIRGGELLFRDESGVESER